MMILTIDHVTIAKGSIVTVSDLTPHFTFCLARPHMVNFNHDPGEEDQYADDDEGGVSICRAEVYRGGHEMVKVCVEQKGLARPRLNHDQRITPHGTTKPNTTKSKAKCICINPNNTT